MIKSNLAEPLFYPNIGYRNDLFTRKQGLDRFFDLGGGGFSGAWGYNLHTIVFVNDGFVIEAEITGNLMNRHTLYIES